MTTKEFTVNWHHRPDIWLEQLRGFAGHPISVLEIGSLEGRSACWMMDNIATHCDSTLTSVDPYRYESIDGESKKESEKYNRDLDLVAAKQMFARNTQEYGARIVQHVMTSDCYFRSVHGDQRHDIVVVDGGHSALIALSDMINGYKALNVGGKMVVDDVEWKWGDGVKRALAAFLSCTPSMDVTHKGYVWFLRKTHDT